MGMNRPNDEPTDDIILIEFEGLMRVCNNIKDVTMHYLAWERRNIKDVSNLRSSPPHSIKCIMGNH
jgi:hypothetical protein